MSWFALFLCIDGICGSDCWYQQDHGRIANKLHQWHCLEHPAGCFGYWWLPPLFTLSLTYSTLFSTHFVCFILDGRSVFFQKKIHSPPLINCLKHPSKFNIFLRNGDVQPFVQGSPWSNCTFFCTDSWFTRVLCFKAHLVQGPQWNCSFSRNICTEPRFGQEVAHNFSNWRIY